MDELQNLPDDMGELRTVHVRTSRYVFDVVRAADGVLTTTYTEITENPTPAQGAGATEPQGG